MREVNAQTIYHSLYFRADVKRCSKCWNERLLSEFTKNRKLSTGLNSSCKICENNQLRNATAKVKKRRARIRKKWVEQNRHRLRVYQLRYRSKLSKEEWRLIRKKSALKNELKYGPISQRKNRTLHGRLMVASYHIKYRYKLNLTTKQIYDKFSSNNGRFAKLFYEWRNSDWKKSLKPILVFLEGDKHILENIQIRRYGQHLSQLFRQYHKEGRLVGGRKDGIPYQTRASNRTGV